MIVPDETARQVIDKREGINVDKWQFYVGSALIDVLPKALRSRFAEVSVIVDSRAAQDPSSANVKDDTLVVRIEAFSVDIGVTVFGKHKVSLRTRVSYRNSGGTERVERAFTTDGSTSGYEQWKTWAGVAVTPLAVEGMNDALGIAMTDAIIRLAHEISRCIDAKGVC